MEKTNTHVKVLNYKDVRDKEMLYVIIENEQGKVIINVGKKTYDNVKAITEEYKVNEGKLNLEYDPQLGNPQQEIKKTDNETQQKLQIQNTGSKPRNR